MIRTVKSIIQRILGTFGYKLVNIAADQKLQAQSGEALPTQTQAELISSLPAVLRRLQTPEQPALTGYQLEMATYDLKTVMADLEPEFFPFYERCAEYTMTSWQRLYSLHAAVRYTVRSNTPGDFVECGVWRGGSMMMIALTLLALGRTDKRLFLFDTFEGLPKPDKKKDIDVWGNNAAEAWEPHRRTDKSSDWAYASLEEVRANMEKTGYPMENVFFVKGMVENTLVANAPQTISLLRLDTDWYSSTKHEMETLYPRLSSNGILIIDDYGHFKGARQAVDEYFKARSTTAPMLTRIDYAGRLAIKAV